MIKSFCDVCERETDQRVNKAIINEEVVLNVKNSKRFKLEVNLIGLGADPAEYICARCLSQLMGMFDKRAKEITA